MRNEYPIEVAGSSGCWCATGAGPTAVLLATPFLLARSYRGTAELLARRFHVITLQMPGSGCGSTLAEPWTIADYARWVAGALDVLAVRPAVLIGHSHSGAVALQLAAAYPAAVDRLVLADTVGGEERRSGMQVLLGRALDALLELRLTLGAWHHLGYNVMAHWRNFWGQVAQAVRTDVRTLARQVQAPTLLAWGARDHTMPLGGAAGLYRRLPRPSLYVSPSGSHDWIVDHAEEFAAVVQDFVARTPLVDATAGPRSTLRREHHELAR